MAGEEPTMYSGSMEDHMTDVIETRTSKFWIGEQGVIFQDYKPESRVELLDARETMEAIRTLGQGKPVLLFSDITNLKSATHQARAFGVEEEFCRLLRAIAMRTNSQIGRVIGNFFIRFNRPPYPSKIFSSAKEALEWITTLKT